MEAAGSDRPCPFSVYRDVQRRGGVAGTVVMGAGSSCAAVRKRYERYRRRCRAEIAGAKEGVPPEQARRAMRACIAGLELGFAKFVLASVPAEGKRRRRNMAPVRRCEYLLRRDASLLGEDFCTYYLSKLRLAEAALVAKAGEGEALQASLDAVKAAKGVRAKVREGYVRELELAISGKGEGTAITADFHGLELSFASEQDRRDFEEGRFKALQRRIGRAAAQGADVGYDERLLWIACGIEAFSAALERHLAVKSAAKARDRKGMAKFLEAWRKIESEVDLFFERNYIECEYYRDLKRRVAGIMGRYAPSKAEAEERVMSPGEVAAFFRAGLAGGEFCPVPFLPVTYDISEEYVEYPRAAGAGRAGGESGADRIKALLKGVKMLGTGNK